MMLARTEVDLLQVDLLFGSDEGLFGKSRAEAIAARR